MSPLWTHKDAAKATGGQAVGEWSINGLSIDTRSIEPGQLFVPLKDIRDGHDFIPMAYEKGAGAVISEHEVSDAPALVVGDSLKALEDLAIASRKRSNAVRIAVTGSVGKTSVKEMIATICRAAGKTHASIKSFNNHWGVPLTLAGMPQDTEYGVFEMGMNHAGELADLSKIVSPNIAIITKIAQAHLAHFNSVEDIAKAKAEIFTSMGNNAGDENILIRGGMAVLPADSPHYPILSEVAENMNTNIELYTFGNHGIADARIISSQQFTSGSRAQMEILGEVVDVELPLIGVHWVENACIALLTARLAGIGLEMAANALKTQGNIIGRGEVHVLIIAGKSITLIDESYNANPESMAAAIAVLGLSSDRKIAVLGDMLELGEDEAALHSGLLERLQDAKIDQVLTCGALMKNLQDVLPKSMNAGWTSSHEKCLAGLLNQVQDGDTIMVKGSNASGMGKLVAALKLHNKKKELAHAL